MACIKGLARTAGDGVMVDEATVRRARSLAGRVKPSTIERFNAACDRVEREEAELAARTGT